MLRVHNARFGHPLDGHDLDDLAQDVSMVVIRKLHEFNGQAALEGWVYRICQLEFLNGMRRKSRAPRALEDIDEHALAEERREVLELERVDRALARVGGAEAEVIRMKHFEGLTFAEIGERLGLSANTIKTRYYRGLTTLERALRSQAQGEGSG